MGNIVPLLFGGSTAKQSSKPVEMQAPEFRALRNPFAGLLGDTMSAGPRGLLATQFGPTAVPQPGAAELGALSDVGFQTMDPVRRGLLEQTMLGNFLPGQAGGNPFLNAVIEMAQTPTRQALEHSLGRTIPGEFLRAGHVATGNSALELAKARQLEAGGRALADIATGISSAAYEGERGRMMQGVAFDQNEIQAAIANFQAQGLPRLLEEGGLTRGIAVGQSAMQSWLEAMKVLGAVTAPAIGQSGEGTAQGFNKGLFGAVFPSGLFNPAAR